MQAALPPTSPPPLVSPQKPFPLWAVFPSHGLSELQQLNGDIRRKVEEPKPSGSSPLGWLAAAVWVATVSVPPTFPSLPFLPSILSAGSVPSTRFTTERGSVFKKQSLPQQQLWVVVNALREKAE